MRLTSQISLKFAEALPGVCLIFPYMCPNARYVKATASPDHGSVVFLVFLMFMHTLLCTFVQLHIQPSD